MTPEITLADLADLLKLVQGILDQVRASVVAQGVRMDDLEKDVQRIAKLADEAAPFLESPLANYMRTRRRLRQEAGHGASA